MGAPSPELCNLWLARAFNDHDVEAAAAMYHPEASIVQVDDVHGGTKTARGADGIRETMAAYIGMKPHMDVVTHDAAPVIMRRRCPQGLPQTDLAPEFSA